MTRAWIIVILVATNVLGASLDAMLSYWLDPLRPSRLEQMGVITNYDTGALKFSKPIPAFDAKEVYDEFIGRVKRQNILARARPDGTTMLIKATGAILRVLMGPFFIIAMIGSIIYVRSTVRRERRMQ